MLVMPQPRWCLPGLGGLVSLLPPTGGVPSLQNAVLPEFCVDSMLLVLFLQYLFIKVMPGHI